MTRYAFSDAQLWLLVHTKLDVLQAALPKGGVHVSRDDARLHGQGKGMVLSLGLGATRIASIRYDARASTISLRNHLEEFSTPEHEAAIEGLLLDMLRAAQTHALEAHDYGPDVAEDLAPPPPRGFHPRRALDWVIWRMAQPEPEPEAQDELSPSP